MLTWRTWRRIFLAWKVLVNDMQKSFLTFYRWVSITASFEVLWLESYFLPFFLRQLKTFFWQGELFWDSICFLVFWWRVFGSKKKHTSPTLEGPPFFCHHFWLLNHQQKTAHHTKHRGLTLTPLVGVHHKYQPLHDRINPKDCQVASPLVIFRVSPIF